MHNLFFNITIKNFYFTIIMTRTPSPSHSLEIFPKLAALIPALHQQQLHIVIRRVNSIAWYKYSSLS